jgi:RNA polymerase sigma-70 factor, ECF subfamily
MAIEVQATDLCERAPSGEFRPVRAYAADAPQPVEDTVLVGRVLDGDTEAYGELVERHLRRAFSVAHRLLGHREDAEDLVQETFLVALARIDTFDLGRSFGPWFYRILVNRGLNARKARSLRYTVDVPDTAAASGPLPDRAAERAELRARVEVAMAELPERQRVALELFEVEGFSGAEIAEILEIPAGTVRWHLHQARQKLRVALDIYKRQEA